MNEQKDHSNPPVSTYENKDVPSNEEVVLLNNDIENSQEVLSPFTNHTSIELESLQKAENTISYQDLPKEKEDILSSIESNGENGVSTGFVPKESLKMKKSPYLRVIIIFTLIFLIGIFGYFIVYPYVARTIFSNPKKVFKTAIQGVSKELISFFPETHDKGIYDLSFTLDSPILEFQKYTGYTYFSHFGFDSENLEMKYGIKNKDKEYSQSLYLKEQKYYTKFSTSPDTLLALSDIYSSDDLLIFSFLSYLRQINKEDFTYMVDFFSNVFIQSLDEEKLSREDARITINEESFKVTRNLYTMDYETKVKTVQTICDHMLEDQKLLAILSSITSEEESKIKDRILALKEQVKETDKEDTFLISIFTYGNKAEIIGFEITHGENKVYFYEREGDFDGNLRLTKIIDGEKNVTRIQLLGENKKNSTEVRLRFNEEDCLQFSVKDFTKEKIDFAYTLHSEAFSSLNQDISGTFLYTKELDQDKVLQTLVISVDIEDEEVKATLTLDSNFKEEVGNINITAATFKENAEYNLLKKQFLNQLLANTPLAYFFSTLSGSYDQDIYDYYDLSKQKEKISIDLNN